MLTPIKQVYSKHSPTFLISLCPLVFSATLLLFHSQTLSQSHCSYVSTVKHFQLVVVLVMSGQLLLRSVGLALIYKCSRQLSTTFYTVFFFLFLLAHAALWIWALVLFANGDFRRDCKDLNEHYFFVKIYALVVSLILIIATLMILVLALPAAILTIKSFKNRQADPA